MLTFNTKDPGLDDEQEPLFEVDGVTYTIPKTVSPNEGVLYLQDVRQGAHDVALARLLHRMIGAEGMNALGKCKGMTREDFKMLLKPVAERVGGLLEEVSSGN